MSAFAGGGTPRFPGFEVLAQAPHWDDATRTVVFARLGDPPPMRYFTPAEEAIARALLGQLFDVPPEPRPHEPDLVRMVDGRLAEGETDGWHYASLPRDDEAWRRSLAALDEDAVTAFGSGFAELDADRQRQLIGSVQQNPGDWHGMAAPRVWSLWTRYGATAFYSHPAAWEEIGFSGPAYPRGYKNLGVDKREPYEVRDRGAEPDTARGSAP